MKHTAETLARAAQALTPSEQADLIDRLLEPITDAEWERTWAVECDARIAELQRGTAELVDANDVMAELRVRLAAQHRDG